MKHFQEFLNDLTWDGDWKQYRFSFIDEFKLVF